VSGAVEAVAALLLEVVQEVQAEVHVEEVNHVTRRVASPTTRPLS